MTEEANYQELAEQLKELQDKKKDHTTIGFNRTTTATIGLVVLVLAGAMFWKDRGGVEARAEAAHSFTVSTHETRINKLDKDVGDVKDNLTKFKEETIEKFNSQRQAQIQIQADQQAILSGQKEVKRDMGKLFDLAIKQIEQGAEMKAYWESIEVIEPPR